MSNYITSAQELNHINGNTLREQRAHSRATFFAQTDQHALEYEKVKIVSNDSDDLFDTWIYSNSSYKEFIESKTMIVSPFQDTTNFFSGQYVFPQRQGGTFIITSFDTQYENKPKGRIEDCNQVLRWIDGDARLHEFPCVMTDRLNASDRENNPSSIPIIRFIDLAKVQLNNYTRTIQYNDRFIFGNQVFEVTGLNEYVNDGDNLNLLTITFARDETRETDDFVNKIAEPKSSFSIQIDQDDFEVRIGDTRQLSATVHKNDVIDSSISVTWESSDTSIMTVDSSGEVTAVADGTATIKASINRIMFAEIDVTVNASPVQTILYEITPRNTRISQVAGVLTFTARKFVDGIEDTSVSLIITDITQGVNYKFNDLGSNQFTLRNIDASNGTVTIRVDDSGTTTDFNFSLTYW